MRYHLDEQEPGLNDMRRNIDAWWPFVEQGVEAIVINASGCGVTVKEYGHYLKHDTDYAEKARRVSGLARDLSEVLAPGAQSLAELVAASPLKRVAYHPPCTLQHGQKVRGHAKNCCKVCDLPFSCPPTATFAAVRQAPIRYYNLSCL
ncbi:hypothetical protein [Crenobacter cavernae]|uniref:hypothetical protein n=1 Tax=Crenobacter cavernae TaxID=2290923 RepID=UPI001FED2427|nr:hypothetical protein [Crenobacter cavernae]